MNIPQRKILYSQKWSDYDNYQNDYWEMVYRYFPWLAQNCSVTYYLFDHANSVYDDKQLMGGSYELVGELSGLFWKKILYLDAFNFQPTEFISTSDERGNIKGNRSSSFWVPSLYPFQPTTHDFCYYDKPNERPADFNDRMPLLRVANVSKATDMNPTMYKVDLQSTHIISKNIDKQLSGVYTYIDYEHQIYSGPHYEFYAKTQIKNASLPMNKKFDNNIGLYVDSVVE